MSVAMTKVTDHVKGMSRFKFYRAGVLYYQTNDSGLEFPVPIVDVEGATLNDEEKSMHLMRWIRKHLSTLQEATEARA
jgi:hypothetical protein